MTATALPPSAASVAAANAASAAVKGNFVVSQSDLWDTHTLNAAKQRQSPRHANQGRCQHGYISQQQQQQMQQQQFNPSNSNVSLAESQQQQVPQTPTNYGSVNNSPSSHMQRSVSEKNRSKHRHKATKVSVMCQSETDSEREQRDVGPICGATQVRKLAKTMQQHSHHHSSPNVAPMEKHQYHRTGGGGGVIVPQHYRGKMDTSTSSIYNACSESELLDGETAILPIFRKLLTEREPRYRSRNLVGASCPNISIKCDIVEYL